jgi:hypothetical protein
MDDRELPWDIRVTGVKAGKTTLKIYNNKTDDVIFVPITVAEPVATGNQAAAFKVLRDFVEKNYQSTLNSGAYKVFEYEDEEEDVSFQLIYDTKGGELMVRETVRIDREEYVSYVALSAEGTTVPNTLYVYPTNYKAYSFKGGRTIIPGAFHEEAEIAFDTCEGTAVGQRELFGRVANLLVRNSLEFVNVILRDVCKSSYSVRDFDFFNIG